MAAEARRKIIAGNWKMNKTVPEALALVRELRGMVSMLRDKVEIVLAPPFVALHPVAKAIEDSNLKLAAQNCHWEASGAFTGEVSAPMLKELGCALRHRGALRAPAVLRRDGRDGEQAGAGGAEGGPDAHRLRGRDAGRARGGPARWRWWSGR